MLGDLLDDLFGDGHHHHHHWHWHHFWNCWW